jgi:hypothetical protein
MYGELTTTLDSLICKASGKTKKKLKEIRMQVKELRSTHKETDFDKNAYMRIQSALNAINIGE